MRAEVCSSPGCNAHGGGTGRVEHTDARHEPVGWRDDPNFNDSNWPEAVAIVTPSLVKSELQPRMAGAAVEITDDVKPVFVAPIPTDPRSFFADFGKEFTGGVRLVVSGGSSGQEVHLRSGERCSPMVFDPAAFNGIGQNVSTSCTTVLDDWGWDFNWTLRSGGQTIEQHQYAVPPPFVERSDMCGRACSCEHCSVLRGSTKVCPFTELSVD